MIPEQHVKRSGKRFVYYRCRGRVDGRPCENPSLSEAAFEGQLSTDLRRLALPREAVQWIVDNVHGTIDATLAQQAASRHGLEKSLAASLRESEALLTLKLRGQVDDDSFERRRLALLDQQAMLRLQLEQPVPTPDAVLARIQGVLDFSASLPDAFAKGDAVRRRRIFHAVYANPVVRDRKALYIAKAPFSFFDASGRFRTWQAIVERLRTWIVERNFQIPPLFFDLDEEQEKRRRAGMATKRKRRGQKRPQMHRPLRA